MRLRKGKMLNASPYVMDRGALPGLRVRSARMPPGFMNATSAPPCGAVRAASSVPSAMTFPIADSPAAFAVRVRSAAMVPTTRLATAVYSGRYRSMMAVRTGSLGTSRVTTTLRAVFETTSAVRWSIARSIAVIARPNEEADVTSLPSIVQLYARWVWPETITSMSSDMRWAIFTMGPETPAHPL